MTKGTVLVASPSAIGSTPVASGSSVPAWPAFCALNRCLTRPTALVEFSPCGLSRMSQPLTGKPLRCRAMVDVLMCRELEHDPEKLQTFRTRSCVKDRDLERNHDSLQMDFALVFEVARDLFRCEPFVAAG